MPNPRELTPSAVDIPEPEQHEAEILDDASGPKDEVRCVIPSFDSLKSTDPMPWMPYVTGAGVFYPKRGDRCLVSAHEDGPSVVQWWQPNATSPDVSF